MAFRELLNVNFEKKKSMSFFGVRERLLDVDRDHLICVADRAFRVNRQNK